jgi:uncharacterized protein Yka (UPF0111/DUF47 family)
MTRPEFFWSAFSDHARHSATAARHLIALLEDIDRRDLLADTIRKLQQRGGEIAHQTVHTLHRTDVTPIDREVIHVLIVRLDEMLDILESASDRVAIYQIAHVRPEAVELARILAGAVDKVLDAVTMLTHTSNETALMELCRAIGAHEQDADHVLRCALARLFQEGTDPVEIVKWRDIFTAIETATDRADDVANTIESIVLDRV